MKLRDWVLMFVTIILLWTMILLFGCAEQRRRGSYIIMMDPNAQHRHAGDGKHHYE
jgi:hypothetical protein